MITRGIAGSIINVASICGTESVIPSLSAYGACKAGVIHLTKHLGKELGPHGIRVNAIAPGLISTDMTSGMDQTPKLLNTIPLGRVGKPEDLDGLVLYLASNQASSYVTGSVFTIDGGLSIHELAPG